MARITINGRKVECEDGIMLIEAVRQAHIYVPTLCYHPAVEPSGACRLCTVEVTARGRKRLVVSCSYPVSDGLEVQTDTEQVRRYRALILELLLARCPKVPRIRELANEYGVTQTRFETYDPDETCIGCGLCVRVCEQLVGAYAIGYMNRGDKLHVSPPFGEPSAACIACGACVLVCPTGALALRDADQLLHSELDLGPPRAIHVPFPQAVPRVPVIDRDSCIHALTGECRWCEQVCEPGAINHEMEDEFVDLEVGSIVLATGFETFDPSSLIRYGYGRLPNVITSLEFERLCHACGPTGGKIRLKDGRELESMAILHCIGSRDENYLPYCSRVCCMYSLKFAHLVREKIPAASIHELYIDMRAFGKGYEEFYHRLLREDVIFIRGKGAEVTDFAASPEEEGKLVVVCEDTLMGRVRRIPVDLVVLSVGLKPRADVADVARLFGLSRSADGFFLEQHPKLAPVATSSAGVFIAGACQGPKDIPDAVAQGAAAAAEALSLIDRGVVEIEPITSEINDELCAGCKTCIACCPFSAISFDEEQKVSVITTALCHGCGTCVAVCPSGASSQRGFRDVQIFAEVQGALVA